MKIFINIKIILYDHSLFAVKKINAQSGVMFIVNGEQSGPLSIASKKHTGRISCAVKTAAIK